MKKIVILFLVSALNSGCLPLAVGYVGYKIADGNENSARIQAQVERERIQMERDRDEKFRQTMPR